jgi:sugar-specific transcriptional regulator TrmB
MPELLERRRRDLEDQLEVLQRELDHWKALSAERHPFEKHHSQIDALSRQMTA